MGSHKGGDARLAPSLPVSNHSGVPESKVPPPSFRPLFTSMSPVITLIPNLQEIAKGDPTATTPAPSSQSLHPTRHHTPC